MSYLTGLATAQGISSLLNAPRDTNAQLRASAGEPAATAQLRRADAASSTQQTQTVRAVGSAAGADAQPGVAKAVDSRDSRYRQFMKALEVLRGATGDPDVDKARKAKLAAEAPQVFSLFDGKPQPVEPVAGAADEGAPLVAVETEEAA